MAQKPAEDKREAIQQFHRTITRVADEERPTRPVGRFSLQQIANVDQTPLPFSFTNGGTYADTGDKTVWVRGGASGLEKRQCTAQITLFADGEPRVKPLLIFKGKGKRISFREKVSRALSMLVLIVLCYTQLQYDRRVIVTFQENACSGMLRPGARATYVSGGERK